MSIQSGVDVRANPWLGRVAFSPNYSRMLWSYQHPRQTNVCVLSVLRSEWDDGSVGGDSDGGRHMLDCQWPKSHISCTENRMTVMWMGAAATLRDITASYLAKKIQQYFALFCRARSGVTLSCHQMNKTNITTRQLMLAGKKKQTNYESTSVTEGVFISMTTSYGSLQSSARSWIMEKGQDRFLMDLYNTQSWLHQQGI